MRYVAAIAYDGTNYAGWQRQKNAVSVQETLENALERAFGKKIVVTASGRTDAGVHAAAQIVHFDAEGGVPPTRLPEAINRFLPDDIAVIKGARARDTFDSNRTAKKKTYKYSLYVSKRRQPLLERYAVRLDDAPSAEKLQKAARLTCGEHDFKAFCAANSSVKTTVRTVYDVQVNERVERGVRLVDFYVTGNGFLYNMVRTMVGEILALASGKRTEESLKIAFKTGKRELLDKTMQAKGLTMMSVDYGYELFEDEEERRDDCGQEENAIAE